MMTDKLYTIDAEIKNWTFPQEKCVHFDPLLNCLIGVARLQNKPFSEQSLIAGLPLIDNRLTPETFIRAAQRIGLSAKLIMRPLEEITNFALPAILLLHNKQACVLVEAGDPKTVQIIPSETDSGIKIVERSSIEQLYSGFAIFLNPQYEFNARSKEAVKDKAGHWFWDVIKHAWPVYGEVLIASFLINIFAMASPLFSMNVYDRVVPNQALDTLWVMAIGVAVVLIFDFLLRSIRSYYIDAAGKSIDMKLSAVIYEQLLGLKMMSRPASAGVLANMVHSFESFREFVTSASISLLVDIPFVLLFIIAIAFIGGSLAWVSIVCVPLIILFSVMVESTLNRKIQELYRYSAEKQATLIESLNAVESIKCLSAESQLQGKWEQLVKNSAEIGLNVRFLSNLGLNFSMFVQYLSSVVVIIWGVYKIAHAEMTVGGLIATTILTGRALAPMSQIAALYSRYFQSEVSLRSIDKLMTSETDRIKGKSYLHRPKLNGAIEFRNVSFGYPNSSMLVLDKCSFKIKPGEKIGIIGRIGSGKSTLEKLILGLRAATGGNILIDDIDISQLDPAELRRNIGYVPQDIILFDGSVRQNITYGAPYVDDVAILRAMEISGVESFVKTHPEGIDMQVGERGSAVSGGQRQAVAIARAVLLDPPILIFDEFTSAMDDRTEMQLKKQMQKYMINKTLLLVTQRASTLSLVERLIILDNGRIVADGPRDSILNALNDAKIRVA